ncbi:MAG TPA: universal stress protein [Candidatus Sulfotelmatobacter sp.]|jgi:nucleotide-binding universal stress UspA family protein|nr:universal stress protein [Candidatus Sulfotelmatobacter sp.]
MNFKTILVAIDGGEQTTQVLDLALTLFRTESGAKLHVVSVIDPLPAVSGGMAGATDLSVESLDVRAHDTVKTGTAYLSERGVAAEGHVAFGNSAQTIIHQAGVIGADLIVVGHRHLSFWERLFDSSTCASILEQAPCPVLVATETSVREV